MFIKTQCFMLAIQHAIYQNADKTFLKINAHLFAPTMLV